MSLNIKEFEEEINCLCNLYLADKMKEAKCQKDRVMESFKEREEEIRAEILKEVEEKGSGMALLQGMKVKESPLIPEGEIWISKKI